WPSRSGAADSHFRPPCNHRPPEFVAADVQDREERADHALEKRAGTDSSSAGVEPLMVIGYQPVARHLEVRKDRGEVRDRRRPVLRELHFHHRPVEASVGRLVAAHEMIDRFEHRVARIASLVPLDLVGEIGGTLLQGAVTQHPARSIEGHIPAFAEHAGFESLDFGLGSEPGSRQVLAKDQSVPGLFEGPAGLKPGYAESRTDEFKALRAVVRDVQLLGAEDFGALRGGFGGFCGVDRVPGNIFEDAPSPLLFGRLEEFEIDPINPFTGGSFHLWQSSIRCPIERGDQAAGALDRRLRSSSSFASKNPGHSSVSQRSLTMSSRACPSPSTAHIWRLEAAKWQKRRPHLRHLCDRREPRAADQSSILTVKSCVLQLLVSGVIRFLTSVGLGWGRSHDCTSRLRAFPFFVDWSGSILIDCPLSTVWFSKPSAMGTSANSAISTNPKPRHRPVALSVMASAATTSPAREKCAKRSSLVTESARLPTYTLGITELLAGLGSSDNPTGPSRWSDLGLYPKTSTTSLFPPRPEVHPGTKARPVELRPPPVSHFAT